MAGYYTRDGKQRGESKMPDRKPMSPRDGAAVADNRLVDREKIDVSSVQPRSSGKLPEQVDWSFKAGLLRFQGKYEQAEGMPL